MRIRTPQLLAAAVAFVLCEWASAQEFPTFEPGAKVPPFQAHTLDGKLIKFPEAYKGKIVLLQFWATWCPGCRAEMPNVMATYQKYHSRGFEVLGVSLEKPQTITTLPKFIKETGIEWPQICDVEGAIAQTYRVIPIPRAILIDGSSGTVIADGAFTMGRALVPLIEKGLSAKTK